MWKKCDTKILGEREKRTVHAYFIRYLLHMKAEKERNEKNFYNSKKTKTNW